MIPLHELEKSLPCRENYTTRAEPVNAKELNTTISLLVIHIINIGFRWKLQQKILIILMVRAALGDQRAFNDVIN